MPTSKLSNDVLSYLEECADEGYVPGAEEFGNEFDGVHGTKMVDGWIQMLGIPERQHSIKSYGSVVDSYYESLGRNERPIRKRMAGMAQERNWGFRRWGYNQHEQVEKSIRFISR